MTSQDRPRDRGIRDRVRKKKKRDRVSKYLSPARLLAEVLIYIGTFIGMNEPDKIRVRRTVMTVQ